MPSQADEANPVVGQLLIAPADVFLPAMDLLIERMTEELFAEFRMPRRLRIKAHPNNRVN